MDHDQQVLQLRDFDQQVLSQPEDAQSFATKSFLETLVDLINYGLEQNDDGTDAYKEELKVIKNATKAFTTVLPTVYKTVCQNEAESRLWTLARSLITLVDSQLLVHGNAGVQINAIKGLQILVFLLSKSSQKDLSLNLLRADHRLLNIEELEKEGQEFFEKIIGMLKSDNESVLTATISCLVLIGKRRIQFLKQIIAAFTSWTKTKTKDDSPVMLRNVDKALKLAFVSLIRTEALAPHRAELIAAFGSIGGNVAMFQSRHSREQRAEESRRSKRAAQYEADRHYNEKRAKTEYVPIIPSASSPNILTNYDITQIPLSAIVNLCMAVLQTVPLEVMTERVSMLPAEGVTLAVTRNGFVRSSTPPYPPPPEQPQFNTNPHFKREEGILKEEEAVKKEESVDVTVVKLEKTDPMDSDEEMENNLMSAPPPTLSQEEVREEERPKVQVLASVEERASQALKMQPYELATQTELSESEKKKLLKMSIQRIFFAEKSFQSNAILSDNSVRKTITDGSAIAASSSAAVRTNPTKSIWLLLVAKLITRGTNLNYKPTTAIKNENEEEMEDNKFDIMDTESSNDLKDLLLDFIVENLSLRNDLALEWLHEEYLFDKRNQRLDPQYTPSYFHWFHKLLEKGIPTLDAKDRILTKLLLDAPVLNAETIEFVKENLHSVPERFVSCVSTLRSLVTNRPTVRFLALQVLLDLCTNENDKIRRTSIVAVKKWNVNQTDINTRVEEFSVEALNVLATEKDIDMSNNDTEQQQQSEEQPKENDVTMEQEQPKEDVTMEGGEEEQVKDDPNAWTEKDVVRHAELYFVLCTKRPSLLKELFSVYIKASENVQKNIRLHMINMIKSIGMKSSDLNKLIREFPPGGETLVIRILVILCESKPPTREIISSVKEISALAEERSIDLTNLAPILAGHSLNYQAKQ